MADASCKRLGRNTTFQEIKRHGTELTLSRLSFFTFKRGLVANFEHHLISQVLQTRDFHTVQKLQIDESYFTIPETKEIYRYIRDTYMGAATNGQVPSIDMARERFPGAYLPASPDSVAILCQQLRRDRLQTELLKLSQDLQTLANTDPGEAITVLRAESAKLASLAEVGQDMSISSMGQTLLEKYETVQSSNGLLGIPYPWGPMNDETQGMQPGQFIVIYGRPKQMKSWVALNMAVHAYINSRKRVLFYTKEMSPFMVAQRVAALITKVAYGAFKGGKLQPDIKHNVFQVLKELLDDEKGLIGSNPQGHPSCFVITTDRSAAAGGAGGGIGWLQSKIRDLKPDLVVVDGMYLMKDDRSGQRTVDWKAIAHISQDLKITAQDFNIPVIGVTQANRAADKSKGEDLTELAYADALGQDADAVFRVRKKVRVDENNLKHTELYITAPGLREGVFDGIVIHGEPATNFDYIRTIVDTENEDDAGKDGAYGKGKKEDGIHKPFKSSVADPKIPAKAFKGHV